MLFRTFLFFCLFLYFLSKNFFFPHVHKCKMTNIPLKTIFCSFSPSSLLYSYSSFYFYYRYSRFCFFLLSFLFSISLSFHYFFFFISYFLFKFFRRNGTTFSGIIFIRLVPLHKFVFPRIIALLVVTLFFFSLLAVLNQFHALYLHDVPLIFIYVQLCKRMCDEE